MTFDLYNYKAHVTGVYDGDSITVDIDLGFYMTMCNQKVRLLGIDTPEIRGDEREQGLVVRDRVRELILDKDVMLKSYKDKAGKYGRWLATILFQEENGSWTSLNQLLLDEGLAVRYYP